jgi:hypothetical protein
MRFLAFLFVLVPIGLFIGAFYVPKEFADYMLISSPFALIFAIYFEIKTFKSKFKFRELKSVSSKKINKSCEKKVKSNNIKKEIKKDDSPLVVKREVKEKLVKKNSKEKSVEVPGSIVEIFTTPSFDSSPNMNWDDGYNFKK